jgi:hypothetical protein
MDGCAVPGRAGIFDSDRGPKATSSLHGDRVVGVHSDTVDGACTQVLLERRGSRAPISAFSDVEIPVDELLGSEPRRTSSPYFTGGGAMMLRFRPAGYWKLV